MNTTSSKWAYKRMRKHKHDSAVKIIDLLFVSQCAIDIFSCAINHE